MRFLIPLLAMAVALPGAPPRSKPVEAPSWIRQAAAQTTPTFPASVSHVVLLSEESVTVDGDGTRVMRERGAVRILQPGDEHLSAFRSYNVKAGRIRDFQGWLISPSGVATAYPRTQVADVALSREYTYDEARARVLECGGALPGSVFAWEITEEEKTVFTQDGFRFQNQEPVLTSRYSVTLPAGWEVKGVVFNHGAFDPIVSGNTWTWEMHDLPWIEREDYSPGLSALAPRLVVSYFPPEGNRAGLQGLKDWGAVSAWLAPLVNPPAEVTNRIRDKAAELTRNAPTELEKIRAIAEFVQKTSYVEVALNITRGGGYTPHRAEDTLAHNYGDCKDKATLMRALLKAAGIDSWLVTITADDRTYVRPEWASPMQFNHAIVAVRVSEGVNLPSVVEDPSLGRLMIFDPTDPFTPVGDLPQAEQGSYALVIAGAKGALLKMPALPGTSRRIESDVTGEIDGEGHLTASVKREYFGQSSIALRSIESLRGDDEVRKRFERGFARRLSGVNVAKISTARNAAGDGVSADIDLGAERFGQRLQDRLFIVRPGLLASGGEYSLAAKQRTAPVQLESDLRRDTIRCKLPAGFKLDEAPGPAKIESPYGTMTAKWAVRDGEIVMDMTLEVRQMTVPASDYGKLRDFFDKVGGAENAAVVMVKQ